MAAGVELDGEDIAFDIENGEGHKKLPRLQPVD